jgi:hypothetical protein
LAGTSYQGGLSRQSHNVHSAPPVSRSMASCGVEYKGAVHL